MTEPIQPRQHEAKIWAACSSRSRDLWPLMGTDSAWRTPKQATNLPKSMQKGQGRAHCTALQLHLQACPALYSRVSSADHGMAMHLCEFKGGWPTYMAARSWVDDPLTWRSSRMNVSCWIKTRGVRSLILLQATRHKIGPEICRLLTNRVSTVVDVSDQHCYLQ
jgi:hypothetical protein